MSQPKKTYKFSEGINVYGKTVDYHSYVALEVDGKEFLFPTLWKDGHRSESDQLRRAIQLVEKDLFYDPDGKRKGMIAADTVE
jgi:hypothetical protein